LARHTSGSPVVTNLPFVAGIEDLDVDEAGWDCGRTGNAESVDAGISWAAPQLRGAQRAGRFDMTVRVEPSKRDVVVSRFDAEPRGTWDSEWSGCHCKKPAF
jgi:hypothetical protein